MLYVYQCVCEDIKNITRYAMHDVCENAETYTHYSSQILHLYTSVVLACATGLDHMVYSVYHIALGALGVSSLLLPGCQVKSCTHFGVATLRLDICSYMICKLTMVEIQFD